MENNNFFQIAQQGFRIAVGAATSAIETIQKPDKRAAALSKLQAQLSENIREWAEKGEITESEAREFLNNILNRENSSQTSEYSYPNPDGQSTTNNAKANLRLLTEEIIALRKDLEKNSESDN